jgi:hypothetical protein
MEGAYPLPLQAVSSGFLGPLAESVTAYQMHLRTSYVREFSRSRCANRIRDIEGAILWTRFYKT